MKLAERLDPYIPSFIIIGSAKCGTTAMSHVLRTHPEVFLVGSEPGLFLKEGAAPEDVQAYRNCFLSSKGQFCLGELNNLYSMRLIFPGTARRIHESFPEARILFLVRHPLERIESWWMQKRRNGDDVHYEFNQALRLSPELLVDTSDYWSELDEYRRCYPDEQIRIVFAEEFRSSPETVIRQVFDFLDIGVQQLVLDSDFNSNVSEGALTYTKTVDLLKENPVMAAFFKFLPAGIKAPIKRALFRRRLHGRPIWDPRTRAWVVNRLGKNNEKFLHYAGKESSFWSLDEGLS